MAKSQDGRGAITSEDVGRLHAALLIRVCILDPFAEQRHEGCNLGIIVPFGSAVFIGIPTIERPTIDRLLLLGGVPVARALGIRNLNICALELALASEDDVCKSVVCCWP